MFHSARGESSACAGIIALDFSGPAARKDGIMKMKSGGLALLALLTSLPLCAAAPNALTPEEQRAGWRLLFDGKSLDGWRSLKSEQPGRGWRAEDGALVLRSKAGDLVTDQAFGDFELSLEWKVAEAANSGVIYRVGLDQAQTFRTGPEYQVLDNLEARDNHPASHRAGALYDLMGVEDNVANPAGQWNQARIVVRGWHVQHWLNGVKTADIDLESAEGRALIARSKFKGWREFASLARGHIALQDHGDVVSFRSIKLRDLNRSE